MASASNRERTRLTSLLFGLVGGLLFGGLLIAAEAFQWPARFAPAAALVRMFTSAVNVWDQLFFLGGLIAIWLTLFVAIVIHELGHFIVGRMVGFSLQSLQLGPITIAFEQWQIASSVSARNGRGGFHGDAYFRLCAPAFQADVVYCCRAGK